MSTKDVILGLAILLLIILVIILGVRSATNSARAAAADQMSTVLVDVLHSEGYTTALPECRGVNPGQYDALQTCLEAVKAPSDLTQLFRQDSFQNYNEQSATAGYLVIQNAKGGKYFASENFTLIINNVETNQHCATPGEIAPGYTCKFSIDQRCNPGDNLEIKYNGQRVFLKTC